MALVQSDDLVALCLKLQGQLKSLTILVDHIAQKVLRPFGESTNIHTYISLKGLPRMVFKNQFTISLKKNEDLKSYKHPMSGVKGSCRYFPRNSKPSPLLKRQNQRYHSKTLRDIRRKEGCVDFAAQTSTDRELQEFKSSTKALLPLSSRLTLISNEWSCYGFSSTGSKV